MHNILAGTKGISFLIFNNVYSPAHERWEVSIKGSTNDLELKIIGKGETVEAALSAAMDLWHLRTKGIPELNPALTYEPTSGENEQLF